MLEAFERHLQLKKLRQLVEQAETKDDIVNACKKILENENYSVTKKVSQSKPSIYEDPFHSRWSMNTIPIPHNPKEVIKCFIEYPQYEQQYPEMVDIAKKELALKIVDELNKKNKIQFKEMLIHNQLKIRVSAILEI